jgi:hypothetical protein
MRIRNVLRHQLFMWWPLLVFVAATSVVVVLLWDSPLPY